MTTRTVLKRSALAVLVAGVLLGVTTIRAQFPGAPPAPKGPWMDKTLSPDQRADLLIAQMTLDEKVSLLHGGGWAMLFALFNPAAPPSRSLGNAGYIPGIAKYGIPDLQMADAAVGVTHGSVFGRYCTALPSGTAEASSWDLDIARAYGTVIGRELHDQGYTMSLGGGIDLAREPRNGRIFEYKGEDAILAGKMVGAEMKALETQGVIGDIKHYAMNDSENGRNFVDVKIDKRSMRESDLLAFEIGVKESGVGAVMCSYNLVNGDYACENDYLLNQVLKKDFGFQGFVVSDWGATHSTAKSALAGLDVQMPEDNYYGDALKKAVESGEVPTARLNDMVHRVLRTEFRVGEFDHPGGRESVDPTPGFEVAQRVEEEGIVLLKNAGGQLPLKGSEVKSIAVIGSHADVGVASGGGSGQVDPIGGNAVTRGAGAAFAFGQPVWQRSSPLEAIRAKAPHAKVEFNAGTDPAAAATLAKASDVAIVFVNQLTSEGNDVPSLSLPDKQDELVAAVAAANPHTIVVLETGGAITMPWIDNVSAAIEAWYPGIRGAQALAGVLFGEVNPSGKLPLTFPKSEADLPHPVLAKQPPAGPGDMKEMFPGMPFKQNTRQFTVTYDEGTKVGYKWYEAESKQPLFAFGHGLSYTAFAYSGLKVTSGSSPSVTFSVKNTGARAGAEIAQIYVTLPDASSEPYQRLAAWQRVHLAPGQSKTVTVALDPHYLSIYDEAGSAWQLLPGSYMVKVGGASDSTPLSGSFTVGTSH